MAEKLEEFNRNALRLFERLDPESKTMWPTIATRWFVKASELGEQAIKKSERTTTEVSATMIKLAGKMLAREANIKPPLSSKQRASIESGLSTWAVIASQYPSVNPDQPSEAITPTDIGATDKSRPPTTTAKKQ